MLPNYRTSAALSTALLLTALLAHADPVALTITGSVTTSNLNNAQFGAGSYSLQDLSNAGAAVGTVTSGGLTGIPLWSLLGGTSAGTSDILTPTPAGDNAKNAILRSYFLATTVTGMQSIISAGEIDPFFGGTGSVPDFITLGTDGKPELVFPGSGASGRNVVDLASLQVLAAPASATGPGGTSSSFSLTGNTATPGNYNLASLQAFPVTTETVSGDLYTGVALWNLLNGNPSNIQDQYVIATGTDGYEAVYSLAELDPALGAPLDLVPYADNQGQFPSDGFARIIFPGDNHQGRYISNLDALAVAVPEPASLALLAVPHLALYLFKRRVRS